MPLNTTPADGYPAQPPLRRGNDLFGLERFPVFSRISKAEVDWAVWFLWVAVTTLTFLPMTTPLRYLCAAYFTLGLVLHPRQLLPVTARSWPVFIIPVLMFASAMWAPSPNEAMRKAFLFVLTGLIPIFVATRIGWRRILIAYLAIEFFGAVLSFMNPRDSYNGAATGIYGHKNWLAMHMFILYMGGLVFMFDKKAGKFLRLFGLAVVPLALLMIFKSKSTTVILISVVATGALLAHMLLWQPATRRPHMRALIVLSLLAVGSVGAFVVLGVLQIDLFAKLLEANGKDATLTGRTQLWDAARHIMAENPWGLGADGFWRPEIGAANELTRAAHFNTFTRFSFHNSYYENGVQIGYLGMYATYFVAGWGLLCAARTWLLHQTSVNALFLVLVGVILMRTTAEIDLASELNPMAILFFIAAIRRDSPEVENTGPPTPAAPPPGRRPVPPAVRP